MIKIGRDQSLDTLLDLHGQIFVIDDEKGYWVKFIVQRVPESKEKPHGLDYSFTLHDSNNERILGFDNAHAVKTKTKNKDNPHDHKHRFKRITPYEYKDAVTLLEDFWAEVDSVLKEEQGAKK